MFWFSTLPHRIFMSFLDRNFLASPYRLMPWLVFGLVLGVYMMDPSLAPYTGSLPDPDDYMRLVQVMNWVQGQGWYDTSQPRLNPSAGTIIHWSRLVDVPIAAAMLVIHHFSGWMGWAVSLQQVALWASYLVPPLYVPLLVGLLAAAARPLLGRGRANLAPLLLVFLWGILFNASPGRVDHHIHILLAAIAGLYALPRVMLCPLGWRAGGWAGAALALGIQIGTEIVPFVLLFWMALGMGAVWRGGIALRNAAVSTLASAVGTAVLVPITLPIEAWGKLAISWFSPAFVILTGLVAGGFGGVWLLGRCFPALANNRSWGGMAQRGAVLGVAGMVACALFVWMVPASLKGAFADYDVFHATRMIANISETQPIVNELNIIPYNDLSRLKALGVFLERVVPLAIIALYAWVLAACAPVRRRSVWLVLAAMVTVFLLTSMFGMIRTQRFAEPAAILVLAHAVFALWERIAARRPSWEHVLGGVAIILLVLVVPLMTAKLIARVVNPPMAADNKVIQCKGQDLGRALIEGGMALPHVVMATYDQAPEILFATPHHVIGANYNVASNRDVYDFFNARDDVTAIALLRRYSVDRVVLCRNFPPFLADREKIVFGENSFLVAEADGMLRIRSNPQAPALIDRLARGDVPPWLKPIPVVGSPDYLLYAVVE